MKPVDCIFFQMTKASQNAVRFWGQKVSELNVTAVQAMVLAFLFDEDCVSSRDLGERTQLDSATLTGIIDRLEGMELVERRPNPADRRAIMVCLTETGTAVAKKIQSIMLDANREFLRELSEDEEKEFRQFLLKMRARR
jgi:DNA-binding MarR family transcriptional regulator